MAMQHSLGSGLRYGVAGDGAPVIALHGSASTGAQWRSLVGYLEGRFRVYTPDLPGYVGSAWAEAPGLAGEAAVIGALIDRIGGPVHLIGHSYGGAVALKLATMRPERLRSLTLIEPAVFHLLRGGAEQRLYREIMGIAAALNAAPGPGSREAAMRLFIDYWAGQHAFTRSSARLQQFFLGCHDRVRADFAALAAETLGYADIARIECPALVAMGLESPTPSLRASELVAEALPRATLRMIPEAGHLAPLTDPHVVDPMIGAHLVVADRVVRLAPAIAA